MEKRIGNCHSHCRSTDSINARAIHIEASDITPSESEDENVKDIKPRLHINESGEPNETGLQHNRSTTKPHMKNKLRQSTNGQSQLILSSTMANGYENQRMKPINQQVSSYAVKYDSGDKNSITCHASYQADAKHQWFHTTDVHEPITSIGPCSQVHVVQETNDFTGCGDNNSDHVLKMDVHDDGTFRSGSENLKDCKEENKTKISLQSKETSDGEPCNVWQLTYCKNCGKSIALRNPTNVLENEYDEKQLEEPVIESLEHYRLTANSEQDHERNKHFNEILAKYETSDNLNERNVYKDNCRSEFMCNRTANSHSVRKSASKGFFPKYTDGINPQSFDKSPQAKKAENEREYHGRYESFLGNNLQKIPLGSPVPLEILQRSSVYGNASNHFPQEPDENSGMAHSFPYEMDNLQYHSQQYGFQNKISSVDYQNQASENCFRQHPTLGMSTVQEERAASCGHRTTGYNANETDVDLRGPHKHCHANRKYLGDNVRNYVSCSSTKIS